MLAKQLKINSIPARCKTKKRAKVLALEINSNRKIINNFFIIESNFLYFLSV